MFSRYSALLLAFAGSSCTPAAVKYEALRPEPSETAFTLKQLLPYFDPAVRQSIDDEAAGNIAVWVADSAVLAFTLYEFRDLLYLDFYVFNGETVEIDASMVSLVDFSKTQLRRLEPHEAGNIFLAETHGVPPDQPKYRYYVSTYTYGNYSHSQVTQQEDPYYALGYSIGSAITRKKNARLTEMASVVYATGLVPGTVVEADAGLRASVCWLNNSLKAYPLRLRVPDIDVEVLFARIR